MIGQMDKIYENASTTIIAAYGDNSQMGLPGVSDVPRRVQEQVIHDGIALLELPLAYKDLSSSPWATRAWTYQEGYLSKRRLVFTETQLLFLCNGMHAAESLQRLVGNDCYKNDTDNFHHLIPKFNIRSSFDLHCSRARDLLSQIVEFSKRELSFSCDSLNAFLGVLNYYTHHSAKLGMPVLHLGGGLIFKKGRGINNFKAYIFWSHPKPAIRRPEFPSWSWAGWGGPIKFDADLGRTMVHSVQDLQEASWSCYNWNILMLDAQGGGAIHLVDLARQVLMEAQKKQWLGHPNPRQLRVSCLSVPVRFKEFHLTGDQRKQGTTVFLHDATQLGVASHNIREGVHATLQIWKGIYIGVYPKWDQQIRLEQQESILGLLFVHKEEHLLTNGHGCLLVRQVAEGFYERVGVMFSLTIFTQSRVYRGCQKYLKDDYAMVFMDETDRILDQVTIPDMKKGRPFADIAERRTICLV